VKHLSITTDSQLRDYCARLARAEQIAFDTEFVSEDSYRPQLCLVQVAVEGELAVIDPLTAGDMTPFWEAVAATGHETVVHAGRQELEFCLHAVGRGPQQLFDVQIAAGLIGLEYPASYSTLTYKILGETAHKSETRTDWRRRPLSDRQIDYALADVTHLRQLRDALRQRLERLNRVAWFDAEMAAWQTEVKDARQSERWRKVAGSSGMSTRGLAIVRELWRWRDAEAERRDCPPRRVLRDDLLAEIAKRRSADPKQIRAVRGMERGDIMRVIPALARAVERALALSDSECPRIVRTDSNSQLTMLGQFLSSALSSICRAAQVAASMVGTPNDVRELVAYRLAGGEGRPRDVPLLAQGWRAEVVGHLLDDLLAGKVSIRIQNPSSEQPLAFEPRQEP
jgi:ribonuclease D